LVDASVPFRNPKSEITSYGVERFVADLLAFDKTNTVNEEIQKRFSPKRVERHLNGVLLVYSEWFRFTEGVYVDKENVDGWGGSGFEVEKWFSQVTWVRIKERADFTPKTKRESPVR